MEESLEGDYIIVVLDASDSISELERKLDVTITILKDIGVLQSELLFIFNKIDKVEKNEAVWINEWFDSTEYKDRPRAFVSALNNDLKDFFKLLDSITHFKRYQISFPDSFQNYKSQIYDLCEVLNEKSVYNEINNLYYTVIELRTRREALFLKLFNKIEQECLLNNLPNPNFLEII